MFPHFMCLLLAETSASIIFKIFNFEFFMRVGRRFKIKLILI